MGRISNEASSTRLPFRFALVLLCVIGPALGQSTAHGTLEGHTYIDARFGLSYTFPSSLDIQPSVNGMPVGTGQKQGGSEFLFAAMEKPTGQVRSGVFITADPKGALGATDVPQFLRSMIATAMNIRESQSIKPITIAGRTFYRADAGFDKPIHIYGAQLATFCNGQFLAFWFSAATPTRLGDLLHTTDDMKLRCSSSPD